MKIDLGLESLETKSDIDVFSEDAVIEAQIAEEEFNAALAELKATFDSFSTFKGFFDTVSKHGNYQGFESMIADKAALDSMLGFDICTMSNEELADIYSNENVADALSKFGTKLGTALGRFGDKLANFVKTTLPFKEKYLKEMTELKDSLSGKKIDAAKFDEKTVASALTKESYKEFIKKHNELLQLISNAAKDSSADNIEALLNKMEEHPDVDRGWFVTYVKAPWLSWFKKSTVKSLGYKPADVIGIIDSAIAAIKNIVELHTTYAKMNEQYNRLSTEISHDRALGDKEEAAKKRETVERLNNYFIQLCEACGVYDITTRRLMYFATYLGRAAKASIQK